MSKLKDFIIKLLGGVTKEDHQARVNAIQSEFSQSIEDYKSRAEFDAKYIENMHQKTIELEKKILDLENRTDDKGMHIVHKTETHYANGYPIEVEFVSPRPAGIETVKSFLAYDLAEKIVTDNIVEVKECYSISDDTYRYRIRLNIIKEN